MMQWIDGKPIGRIMPTMPDSRQQPKSLAMKLIADRTRPTRGRIILRPSNFVQADQPAPRCTFIRFGKRRGGSIVFDADTGQALGTILPTVSDAVLRSSPGLQSWSKAGATNSPTRKGS